MDDDILFKLGFEAHPRANASLETLAKAVEETEKRISRIFDRVAVKVESTAARVRGADSGRGGSTSGGDSEADQKRKLQDRLIGMEAELTAAYESQIEKRLATAQKYNEQLDTLAKARMASAAFEAKVLAGVRQQVNSDVDFMAKAESVSDPAVLGMTREQLDKELAVRYERIQQYQDAMGTVEKQILAEAETTGKQRTAAEKAAAAERLKAEKEAAAEKKRIAADEQRAARAAQREQERLVKEQQRVEKAAATEKVRQQREAAQAAKRAQADAARIAKEEERERAEAVKTLQAVANERRKMEIESRNAAMGAALPWIEAYEKEQLAHERAMQKMAQGREQFVSGLNEVSGGIGKLTRGAVLLGLSQGAAMEEVIRQLALVQAGVDLVAGSAELIRGIARGWASLLAIKQANVAMANAETASAKVAVEGSAQVTAALQLEALTARQTAAAHAMLNTSRGVGGAAGAAVGTAATTAAGSAVGAAATGAAGTAATAAVGGGIAAAFFAKIKLLAGAIAGVLSAPVLGLAAAGIGAILGPFVYKLMGERKAAEASLKKAEEMQTARDRKIAEASVRAQSEADKRTGRLDADDENLQERIGNARTPASRLAIIDSELETRRNAVASFRALATDTDMGNNADDTGDHARALDALADAQKRYQALLGQQLDVTRQLKAEERQATLEKIKGIEDAIKARQQERKAIEDSFLSAKERFGALGAGDQAMALQALQDARTMKAGTLDEGTVSRLEQVGTDEARRLIQQNNLARADAAGFDAAAGGEKEQRLAALAADDKAAVGDLATLSGQAEADIAGRASNPAQVEIVDRTQLEVQMNVMEDQFFDRIVSEMDRVREEMLRALESRINARQAEQLQQIGEQFSDATSQRGLLN